MSIVDANGKNLKPSEDRSRSLTYRVGNIQLSINATPNDRLNDALAGARQIATMQLIAATKQRTASTGLHIPDESLKIQAMAEASKIEDPFSMEPCAQAVFMMLAKEIESRDAIIQKLITRVEELEKRWSSKQAKEPTLEDGRQN